jgi:hypothetical protein
MNAFDDWQCSRTMSARIRDTLEGTSETKWTEWKNKTNKNTKKTSRKKKRKKKKRDRNCCRTRHRIVHGTRSSHISRIFINNDVHAGPGLPAATGYGAEAVGWGSCSIFNPKLPWVGEGHSRYLCVCVCVITSDRLHTMYIYIYTI